jgi:hypothetical protein
MTAVVVVVAGTTHVCSGPSNAAMDLFVTVKIPESPQASGKKPVPSCMPAVVVVVAGRTHVCSAPSDAATDLFVTAIMTAANLRQRARPPHTDAVRSCHQRTPTRDATRSSAKPTTHIHRRHTCERGMQHQCFPPATCTTCAWYHQHSVSFRR